MTSRRLLYLAAVAGLLVFYWAYREWLSGLFLILAAVLPLFALLVSLPGMLAARLSLHAPNTVELGQEAVVTVTQGGKLPCPRMLCRLQVTNRMTGQVWRLRPEEPLPTEHCGLLLVEAKKVRVLDYLDLLRLPGRHTGAVEVLVRPAQVPLERIPDVTRFQADVFRPKPGGGFAENHELRLYRPGDHLRQVHWKLSAKTGKLIIREPLEPVRGRVLVTVLLRGTPEELDRKLGQLLWISRHLLLHGLPHVIHCATGSGTQVFSVSCDAELVHAVDSLLGCPQAPADVRPEYIAASWHYHVGGDSDDA